MQDFLNTLLTAHQQIKDVAIQAVQNDQELEPHVLESIKTLYTLIQTVKQATGL